MHNLSNVRILLIAKKFSSLKMLLNIFKFNNLTSRLAPLQAIRFILRPRQCSQSSLNVNTNVAKDVILFKYEQPRFFKILNIFALSQFGFWAYLSHFAFTTLRDVPVPQDENLEWWRKLNLGENKYRITLTIAAFLVGYGILLISWMFTLKSVRYLVLHKGGQKLSFVTYAPFGKNRILTVGLENVSCKETRSASRSQLPIKVKDHYLHYILDMKGEFRNEALFDHTAGLRRTFK